MSYFIICLWTLYIIYTQIKNGEAQAQLSCSFIGKHSNLLGLSPSLMLPHEVTHPLEPVLATPESPGLLGTVDRLDEWINWMSVIYSPIIRL